MENYYLDISLSRWAIINYSSYIWKRPELKEKLVNLTKNYVIHRTYEKQMISALHEEVDKLRFPCRLKDELKFAIGSMGREIRYWLGRLFSFYKANETIEIDFFNCIDHIQWSYLGCIDSVRTTESLYKSKLLPVHPSTWLWLSNHCLEDCILDCWDKLSKSDTYAQTFRIISSSSLNNYELLDYYWILRMQNQLHLFEEKIVEFDGSETIDEFMFRKAYEGQYQTIMYFWNRLGDDQKKAMLIKVAHVCDNNIWLKVELNRHMDYFMFLIRLYENNGFEKVIVKMLDSQWVLEELLICPGNPIRHFNSRMFPSYNYHLDKLTYPTANELSFQLSYERPLRELFIKLLIN